MSQRILIIGGGLSGLHSAYELHRRGRPFLLVEARRRLGGRILSKFRQGEDRSHGFDLGPAWFWPGQLRMYGLMQELGLENEIVDQFAEGDELVERAPGAVMRGRVGISMAGSYRLRGGMRRLIDRLAESLPEQRIRLGTRANRLELENDGVTLHVETREGALEALRGDRAVLALPPRVALATLELAPDLEGRRRAALQDLPTWMAGQGKFVALYERPFWRAQGLSGDAVSYVGPLGEIHDITPDADAGSAAGLFGFFALPAQARRVDRATLEEACVAQLTRIFGEAAASPLQVFLKDWAFDDRTATPADLQGPAVHALTGLDRPEEPAWNGRLLWSGSESASPGERHNGYLEGALEASQRTLELLS